MYRVIEGEKYGFIRAGYEKSICSVFHTEFFSGSNPYYWDAEKRKSKKEFLDSLRECDRKHRQVLKKYAEEFEAEQKQKSKNPRMTREELKYILIKEEVHYNSWDILETGKVGGYDGYVLTTSDDGGYDIFYRERGNFSLLEHIEDEHIACLLLLNEFAEDGKYGLVKYINFSELPQRNLLTTRNPNTNPPFYDLQSAIKLSLKLGRALTAKESKQFESDKY